MNNFTFLDTSDLRSDEIFLRLEKTREGIPEKGLVPDYLFKICLASDGTEVGECSLRVGHNERLYFGGNIGYGVSERHRGRHYAGKACLLLFGLARKHGLKYLYITCDPENHASRRTCEYAGGALQTIAELPEDNDMYQSGRRRKCVYRFELYSLMP